MADFTIGDYQYDIVDSTNNYVRAYVVDKTKTSYSNIPTSITNNNITYQVINMLSCYQDCTSLVTEMSIPQNITNLYQCFQRCTNLQSISAIPSSVINMEYCFQNCTSLTGTIHVYNNPTSYTNIFSGTTKPIYIIPHGSAVKTKWEIIAASYSNVIVLQEPAIDTYHNAYSESITFGGYEETNKINRITSYLNLIAEKNIYISDNSELNAAIDSIEVLYPFYFEIEDITQSTYIGFRQKNLYSKGRPKATDLALDSSQFTNYVAPTFEYSYDLNTWNSYTLGTSIYIGNNQTANRVYFRGDNLDPWFDYYSVVETQTIDGEDKNVTHEYTCFVNAYTGTNIKIKSGGNIMSLRYKNFINQETIPCSHAFSALFQDCAVLTTPPVLPATTLQSYCYGGDETELGTLILDLGTDSSNLRKGGMFYGCSSLKRAPKLPATTLTDYCYYNMFAGQHHTIVESSGVSFINAPELPATTLAPYCYGYMFYNCKQIISTPKFPATTLADHCYYYMFRGCTSLINILELSATTLADYCYAYMFYNCTSLINAPELPVTTLADHCYYYMFNGCTSLVNAPELSATTLTSYCYGYMFSNCTSLVNAPELPATTLAGSCYYYMFNGCTSLVNAPELPATTLAGSCYYSMFSGCGSLIAIPALPATTLADYCYSLMYYSSSKTGIKANDTQTTTCPYACIIPSSGTGTASSKGFSNMFLNEAGDGAFNPSINTTFYTSVPTMS